jgi:hypothetical protein
LAFDGSGDYLSIPTSSDLAFGTGDFTIELWAYSRDVSSSAQRGFLQISPTTGGLSTSYANGILLVQGIAGSAGQTGGLAVVINGTFHGFSAGMTTNAWHHIAVTRSSGTVRLFFNGTEGVSATNTSNLTGSNLAVGGYYSTTYLYDGYIDDLRITKGVARYTSNFTPPTAPLTADANTSLLLHFDNVDIIDSSSTPKAITAFGNAQISTAQSKFGGGSLYFDGSGDYLSVPDSTDWDVSGDYTIEFWAIHASSGSSYTKGYLGTNSISGTSGFGIGHYLGNLTVRTASSLITSTGALITSSVWNHIAIVWSSSTLKGYVNGTEVLSTTAYTTSTAVPLIIGNFNNLDPSRYYGGYIDDLRITKGVARYTSNFTPPTAPFPDA